MPQGLQIFDVNGKLILGVTDRLTRVLGIFNTGTNNGSITNEGLLNGDPWYFIYPTGSTSYAIRLNITFSGSTLSWAFVDSRYKPDNKILYGVY